MAQSSTLSSAAGTAGSWLFAGLCIAGSVIYFDELRKIGGWAMGVPAIEEANSKVASRTVKIEEAEILTARDGHVTLRADSRGHFITDAQVNGRSVEVMVDTGASSVALSWEDAEAAGIFVGPSDFTQRANTANGVAKFAPITIDTISIGNITVRNVRGTVAERGKLSGTLLGMTFLGRLTRAELSRGTLILEE
jgi:aspartyl protease family protein